MGFDAATTRVHPTTVSFKPPEATPIPIRRNPFAVLASNFPLCNSETLIWVERGCHMSNPNPFSFNPLLKH
ncbi:hypothetical protein VIGAN_03142200, partial [Vigna angularis var. angularis]